MSTKIYYFAACVAAVILFFGYLLDVKYQASAYLVLQTEEKEIFSALLLQRMEAEKRVNVKTSHAGQSMLQTNKNSGLVFDITMLAELNDLRVQDVGILRQANGLRLVVEGEMEGFAVLINAFLRQPMPILVGDFSIKPLHAGNLRMTLLVTWPEGMDGHLVMVNGKRAARLSGLFCHFRSQHVAEAMIEVDRNIFSMQQIKMSGYVSLQGRPHALLVMPNHVTIDAVIGDVIGSERAVLSAIRRDGCDFIQQQKKLTLMLGGEREIK